ncbi:uncharacterized protein [Triticum aestivum]|uniref:uncharacterized protein n=1 Tax=Triticum aestivum TaxID=4565 RepID=UPI001D01BE58|nr:uncharacterized protein LOC123102915 [Triticum aestivum]
MAARDLLLPRFSSVLHARQSLHRRAPASATKTTSMAPASPAVWPAGSAVCPLLVGVPCKRLDLSRDADPRLPLSPASPRRRSRSSVRQAPHPCFVSLREELRRPSAAASLDERPRLGMLVPAADLFFLCNEQSAAARPVDHACSSAPLGRLHRQSPRPRRFLPSQPPSPTGRSPW